MVFLTNIGTLKQAVTVFKCRSGIEAMFKDCKTGGYNLEKSYACDNRLKTLILLIALAYSCAILQGRIAVLKKVRYALCPIPYALCPMPYAHEYLIFLRKAISLSKGELRNTSVA